MSLSGVNNLSLRENARIRLAASYSRAAEELTFVADFNCRVENVSLLALQLKQEERPQGGQCQPIPAFELHRSRLNGETCSEI